MNRNLKNEEVKKYITIGAVLIILYWALQNLQLIFSVMSKILTLFMPFLIGGVIAFIMNVPMKQIERHLFQKEQYQTEKFAALRRTCAYVLTLLAINSGSSYGYCDSAAGIYNCRYCKADSGTVSKCAAVFDGAGQSLSAD